MRKRLNGLLKWDPENKHADVTKQTSVKAGVSSATHSATCDLTRRWMRDPSQYRNKHHEHVVLEL